MALIYRNATIEDRIYEVMMSYEKFQDEKVDILTWCYDNFGKRDDSGLWDWMWNPDATTMCFYFLKETHAMAFKLRWK